MQETADNFFSVFLWAGIGLFVLVLCVLPALAVYIFRKKPEKLRLKGLGLPEGSVRSMLALLIVGSYMIVALIGAGYKGTEELKHLGEVLSALAGVAGAVIGFYFGSRGSKAASTQENREARSPQKSNRGDSSSGSSKNENQGT